MNINEVGMCGRACGVCRFFKKECRGCRAENKISKSDCVISRCAKKKKVRTCLTCSEMPCKLLRTLLKSYCPVYDDLKHKFGI